MSKKLFAFTLMPFNPAFEDTYRFGIKASAEELGILAERVDEQRFHDVQILQRIYNQINAADFIIADMTGQNPNVFYEVGYAHARDKICLLLTQRTEDIPFDLKHHRHIVYGGSIKQLADELKEEMKWVVGEIERRKTRPIDVDLRSVEGTIIKSELWSWAEVTMLFDLSNRTAKHSAAIDAIYFYCEKTWTFKQNDQVCPETQSDLADYERKYFVLSPVARLQSGGWAQIKLVGRKTIRFKDVARDRDFPPSVESYPAAGRTLVRIMTAEGSFDYPFDFNIIVMDDEIPF